jgi:16S rRNA (guanine527-N7)-methyltransferase
LPDLSEALATRLLAGCEALDLAVDSSQQSLLIQYLELMVKWNKAYNLTAVRDPGEMVIRHLLDSLAISPYIEGERFLDVGTGAGLPGVPLAILYPGRRFHLLDSNGKKTRFLFQVKTALGLDNMTAHQARVESFASNELFDGVLSRAFASLQDMIGGARHLLAPKGSFYAMKGAYPEDEIEALEIAHWETSACALTIPGLNEERHLITIQHAGSAGSNISSKNNQ